MKAGVVCAIGDTSRESITKRLAFVYTYGSKKSSRLADNLLHSEAQHPQRIHSVFITNFLKSAADWRVPVLVVNSGFTKIQGATSFKRLTFASQSTTKSRITSKLPIGATVISSEPKRSVISSILASQPSIA